MRAQHHQLRPANHQHVQESYCSAFVVATTPVSFYSFAGHVVVAGAQLDQHSCLQSVTK